MDLLSAQTEIRTENASLRTRVSELEAQLAERDKIIRNGETYNYGVRVGSEHADKFRNELTEAKKIIALAREAISYALRKDYNCNGITCAKKLEEALAAIDDSTLVAGMVLCSTERDRMRDAALLRKIAMNPYATYSLGTLLCLANSIESGEWEPKL